MLKFMFGAVLGATIALLVAPRSGEEFRQGLSDQLDDTMEKGKTVARQVSRRAREFGEQAQERVRRAAGTTDAQSTEA